MALFYILFYFRRIIFMKKRLVKCVAAVSMIAASLMATSACYWVVYQPEEPKCLQK